MPSGLNTPRLYTQLLNTRLQQKDNPLYQIIRALIGAIAALEVDASGGGGGGGGITNITNVTQHILGGPTFDGSDGQDGMPGTRGDTGPAGIQGLQGLQGIPGIDGLDADEPIQIPGPQGIQGPSGGGGGSATTAVVTTAFPAKRNQHINVVDGTVVATSNILVWLTGIVDGQPNSGDLVDVYSMRAIANTGSFDLDMDFLTPWAGSLSIDYMVLA